VIVGIAVVVAIVVLVLTRDWRAVFIAAPALTVSSFERRVRTKWPNSKDSETSGR
jgi:hypothetical protein